MSVSYAYGDIFASVGSTGNPPYPAPPTVPGAVLHYSNLGVLKNTLYGDNTQYTTGLAFNTAGMLFVSCFTGNVVSRFASGGSYLSSFGSGYDADPESIVIDNEGNVYVGQADGTQDILKFNSTGQLIESFDVATENRGSDWIELASDQCTMFYTSEGTLIKRYDVCSDEQLTDFATLPSGEAYALKIRANGEVMVAATGFVYRLDSSGAVIQTYSLLVPSTELFALNLDPDGVTFWSGDLLSGRIWRVNIATGAIVTTWVVPIPSGSVFGGLAVFGEKFPPLSQEQYQRIYGWRANISDEALETLEVFSSPQGFV